MCIRDRHEALLITFDPIVNVEIIRNKLQHALIDLYSTLDKDTLQIMTQHYQNAINAKMGGCND